MDNIVWNREGIPILKTLGKMVLCQEGPIKGNAVDNYRPILYFPLMWKLTTGTIAESIYSFLM